MFLDDVAKSPLLNASEEGKKQIRAQIAAAEAAAKKDRWGEVAVAVAAADAVFGRCDERAEVDTWRAAERKWLTERYDRVIADGIADKPTAAAKKLLRDVQQAYRGQPEADVARLGVKALGRLAFVRKVEAGGNAKQTLRADTAAEFDGTPWTRLFEQPKDEQ